MHGDLLTGIFDVVGIVAQLVTTASRDAKLVVTDGGVLTRVVIGSLLVEVEDEMNRIWLTAYVKGMTKSFYLVHILNSLFSREFM